MYRSLTEFDNFQEKFFFNVKYKNHPYSSPNDTKIFLVSGDTLFLEDFNLIKNNWTGLGQVKSVY